MTAMRRWRRPALVVALVTTFALLLTGCSFWDWLAGRPITRPAAIPVDEDQGEDSRDPGRADPVVSTGGGAGSNDAAAGGEAPDPGDDGAAGTDQAPGGGGNNDTGGTGETAILPNRCSLWSGGLEPSPGPFEQVTVEPVDEGDQDPSFAQFRTSLLEALARRDVAALEAAIDPQIKVDFGGGTGLDAFRRQWGLDRDPENSPIWEILTDILKLGGVMTGGSDGLRTFTAPYVYALYNASLDPFGHAVVTGAGVNVRAEPSVEAQILDQATHLVVRVVRSEEELPTIQLDGRTYCWVRIQLPSGEIGYVADRFLWSPVGWRAAFQQGEEGWKMTFLVAGD